MTRYRLTADLQADPDVSFTYIQGQCSIRMSNGMTWVGTVERAARAGFIEVVPNQIDLENLQAEVAEWAEHNFDMPDLSPKDQRALIALTGVAEEAGEIVRAIRKLCQGIRGTREEWIEEIKKESGDVVIQLCSALSSLGLSLNDCVASRWESVGKRDWKAFPKNGLTE